MLSTPVLFLVFNRPITTAKVFETIRQAKPKQLFIAADGPRVNKPEDIEKCSKVREIAMQVDWDCEVKTLFRDQNLGCGKGVSTAISWFFNYVEAGIILEDDCLPEETFFPFCSLMLEQYKDCNQVMFISGTNHLFSRYDHLNSYYFSDFGMIWGWATWKRTWQNYSFSFDGYEDFVKDKLLEKKYRPNFKIISWLGTMIEATKIGKIDTWDVQLFYLLVKTNGLAIVPLRNQIKNIGYSGTHTVEVRHPFFEMPTKPLYMDRIISPKLLKADINVDALTYKIIIKYNLTSNLINRIRNLLPSYIRDKYRIIKKTIMNK